MAGSYSQSPNMSWMSCAAIWCASVTQSGRHMLLKENCMGAIQQVIQRACDSGTVEHGGSDAAFTCAARDKLYTHSIGALGVLVCDKAGGAVRSSTRPTVNLLLFLCASA